MIVVLDRYAKKKYLEYIKESNSFVGLLHGICRENPCYFLEQKILKKSISAVFNFILKSTSRVHLIGQWSLLSSFHRKEEHLTQIHTPEN